QTEQGNSSSLSTYSFESDHSTDSEYAYKEIRKRGEQGSSAFVPQTAGHMLASLCVRKLLGKL
ncbi:MAG TPA: hypothetical protein PLJ83_06435, partial [Spirochaetales bacterium]|nr:hypothetical protein [Spirochaetales bacterium]